MPIDPLLMRCALVLCAACATGAFAQDVAPEAAPAPLQAQLQPAARPDLQQSVAGEAFLGQALQAERLEDYRGGFDSVNNDLQLTSAVAGNAAVNVLSGSNSIADGAFANSSGLPMVIQNSGSNVSIQNATIVNVQLN